MSVQEIQTISDFKKIIGMNQNSSDNLSQQTALEHSDLVVIDFFADWCGPCKRIAPQIVELSKKYPTVKFCKINTDTPTMSVSCEACKINSLPTFCFFKSGSYVDEFVGANIHEIETKVQKHLEKN
jgi:thioredoxin 1